MILQLYKYACILLLVSVSASACTTEAKKHQDDKAKPQATTEALSQTNHLEVEPVSAKPSNTKASVTRVLVFGDSGSCDEPKKPELCVQHTVAQAMKAVCDKNTCDLGVMLGDNIYEVGVSSPTDDQFRYKYDFHYDPLGMPIYAALGNHDVGDYSIAAKKQITAQIERSDYSKTWRMLGEYYKFQHKDVDFFVINSNDFDKEQLGWLRKQLQESNARWRVVYGHHPVRSNGWHGDTPKLVMELLPLLCAHADLYLAGHDHDLQMLDADCGIPLVVSGAAGKSRPTNTHALAPRREWSSSGYGFAHLAFEHDSFDVSFYNEKAEKLFFTTRHKVLPKKRSAPK